MLKIIRIGIIFSFALSLFFSSFHIVLAENPSGVSQNNPINFTPQVKIPGVDITKKDFEEGTAIGKYIKGLYNYATAIVGVVAAIVLMYGGITWITAGGNMERVSNAKAWISAAITGLVLVMTAYTILYVVNPNLLEFKAISITPVYPTETQDSGSGVVNYRDKLIDEYGCSEILESEGACVDFCEKTSFFLDATPINVNGTTQYCCYCDQPIIVNACCLSGDSITVSDGAHVGITAYKNCQLLKNIPLSELNVQCVEYKYTLTNDEKEWECASPEGYPNYYYCGQW